MQAPTTPPEPHQGPRPAAARPQRARRSRFAGLLAPLSPAPVYVGIIAIVAGLGTLAYTWSRVAGTAIVALQLPYVISGGFTGIALVVLGVLSMYLGAKRRDSWQRDRRLEELAAILEGATGTRGDEEPDEPASG
jgi:hypothetical protein